VQVTSVPGVAAIVRNLGHPLAVPDADLDNVRRFVDVLNNGGPTDEPELIHLPERGTQVRVRSGPFAGISGIVLEHRGRSRLLVGLEAVGLGAAIDIGGEAVEAEPTP
jgi:transcription antitermination factor NusG